MTLTEATNKYLTQCENTKKLEYHTIRAYKNDLNQFCEFAQDVAAEVVENISALDKKVVQEYVDKISPEYAAKTLKRKVASLKAFFTQLEFDDIISINPFRKIRLHIKEPKAIPKSLTLQEMGIIFTHLYKKELCKRTIALVELLFDTGVRISELCNIMLCDINLENRIIKIRGKGNRERVVFISNNNTMQAIRDYIAERSLGGYVSIAGNSPYLFLNRAGGKLSTNSARVFIKKLSKNALNKRVTPHMFRHTFATLLLEQNIDLTYIKSFLGHSSIATTQIYARATTSKQKQLLTNLHPRNHMNIATATE